MKKCVIVICLIILPVFLRSECRSLSGSKQGELRVRKIRESIHYNGKTFVNPVPTVVTRPGAFFNSMRQWMTGDEKRVPGRRLETCNGPMDFPDTAPGSGLRITWINHSTVLIEIEGKRFLTDPIWSRRCSPWSFAGPERFFEVPLALEKLPPLDGIIISHDHYDHLDEATVRKLAPAGVMFYAPLGVGAYLEEWGVRNDRIAEFDWGDSVKIGNITLVSAPARHFSGRGFFGRDKTFWCSWVLIGENRRVFYSGDTGLFQGLKDIGDMYGPFDVTILEIGAYHPNWGQIHLGPENAVTAHELLGGKVLLPVHWGTFQLAFHAWSEPVETLVSAAGKKNMRLMLPKPGEPVSWPELEINSRWWEPGAVTAGR